MTKKEFAKKIAKCTASHWGYVLRGERNLGYKKSEIVARVLNTPVDLWINPSASPTDRMRAWEKFSD